MEPAPLLSSLFHPNYSPALIPSFYTKRGRAAHQGGLDRKSMHFNFDFSTGQILWTLTFAALLVLLVVLLGRDRARRFKWFTASMVLMALRMLASRLLLGRMAPIVSSEIFLVLADLSAIIAV